MAALKRCMSMEFQLLELEPSSCLRRWLPYTVITVHIDAFIVANCAIGHLIA